MLFNDYLERGGEHQSVHLEAQSLRAAGHDVLLHAVDNSVLREAPLRRRVSAVVGRSVREAVRRSVRDLLVGYRPDLVHCQNLFPGLGAGAIAALSDLQVPYVRHLRNYRLRCISGDLWRRNGNCGSCRSASTGLAGLVHRCYRGSALQSAGAIAYARADWNASCAYPPDALIMLSDAMRAPLHGVIRQSQRIYVKPNPVQMRDAGPGGSDFLFVGRLAPGKNWQQTVRLAESLPHRTFQIVGDGPHGPQLEAITRTLKNIAWTRSLPHPDVLAAMAVARAVLVPSNWREPFGRVAAEALSVGTPCLVSGSGGLPEVVAGLPSWFSIPADDDVAWRTTAEKVADMSPSDYSRLREMCHERAAAFSFEKTANDLIEIYTDVLSRTSRKRGCYAG